LYKPRAHYLVKKNATAAGDGPRSPAAVAVVLLLQHGQVGEKAYTSREGSHCSEEVIQTNGVVYCAVIDQTAFFLSVDLPITGIFPLVKSKNKV
jgi:hypothetical protein